jgi:hypothetical protein
VGPHVDEVGRRSINGGSCWRHEKIKATSLTSFMHARGWHPSSVFGPGVIGSVAALGAVAAGAAIFEAALIPGLLIGGAAAPGWISWDDLGSGIHIARTLSVSITRTGI